MKRSSQKIISNDNFENQAPFEKLPKKRFENENLIENLTLRIQSSLVHSQYPLEKKKYEVKLGKSSEREYDIGLIYRVENKFETRQGISRCTV